MFEYFSEVLSAILIIVFFMIFFKLRNINTIAEYFKEQHKLKLKKETKWKCPECRTELTNTFFDCYNCGFKLKDK